MSACCQVRVKAQSGVTDTMICPSLPHFPAITAAAIFAFKKMQPTVKLQTKRIVKWMELDWVVCKVQASKASKVKASPASMSCLCLIKRKLHQSSFCFQSRDGITILSKAWYGNSVLERKPAWHLRYWFLCCSVGSCFAIRTDCTVISWPQLIFVLHMVHDTVFRPTVAFCLGSGYRTTHGSLNLKAYSTTSCKCNVTV